MVLLTDHKKCDAWEENVLFVQRLEQLPKAQEIFVQGQRTFPKVVVKSLMYNMMWFGVFWNLWFWIAVYAEFVRILEVKWFTHWLRLMNYGVQLSNNHSVPIYKVVGVIYRCLQKWKRSVEFEVGEMITFINLVYMLCWENQFWVWPIKTEYRELWCLGVFSTWIRTVPRRRLWRIGSFHNTKHSVWYCMTNKKSGCRVVLWASCIVLLDKPF